MATFGSSSSSSAVPVRIIFDSEYVFNYYNGQNRSNDTFVSSFTHNFFISDVISPKKDVATFRHFFSRTMDGPD